MHKKSFTLGMSVAIVALCVIFYFVYDLRIREFDEKLNSEIEAAVERYAAENEVGPPVEIFTVRDMSDDEVIMRARLLGMEFQINESKEESAQKDESETSTDIEIEPEATPMSTSISISELEPQIGVETANAEPEPSPTVKPKPKAGATVHVTIPPGYTAAQIAQLLQDEGIISKAWDFQSYLALNGYTRKMVSGTFRLTAGADFDKLADVLVKK